MPFLFLAFVLVPLAEIALFVEVGGMIGLWPTLGIVVLTAFAGTALLRAQGLAAFGRAQASMAEGRLPVEEVVHGFCLVIAGALLLTPGFLTDAIGLALFIPPVRLALGRAALRWMSRHGTVQVYGAADFRERRPDRSGRPDVVEGEAQEVAPAHDEDEDQNPPDRSTPWAGPRG